MSQKDKKPWERPWAPQEMIENASNWNLAGDAGLLMYLEDFSEKMLSRVKDTNDNLNNLIDDADAASLALQNATNQFMGLRNTQFIESRVYEDDETLPIKPIPEKEEKPKATKEERLEEMKQAICNGLEIIDKYYEKVEIPESDSDDDTDGPNILYRPIDPYIDRPLPYVIGTAEWHKYWHVGLGHSSSDSEVENEEDQFSETESEQEANLPERDRTQIPGISDSESEDMPKNKMSKPVANSTFNDNTNRNMFDSSSDSETGSLPPQVRTVNSNFAEELAAKLGKVQAEPQIEVNKKPIQKHPTNIPGGLFSDEPPPLDEDDNFGKKNTNSGLFSGGDNLFDDVDDDSDFWNVGKPIKTVSNPVNTKKPQNTLFEAKYEQDDIFSNESDKQVKKQPEIKPIKRSSGLFDDEDDDLFSTALPPQPKKTILAPFKPTAPLVSEEPPDVEPTLPEIPPQDEIKKKKPVGGVSVLGPNVLLQQNILKNRPHSSSESDNDFEPNKPILEKIEPPKESKKLPEVPKITSIFDDTSPLFSDDIFNIEKPSKLFESVNDNDLFKTDTKIIEQNEKSKSDLFENNKQSNLFVEEPPPLSKSSLFDDEDDLFSTKPKISAKPDHTSNSGLFPKHSGSLFDDLGDEVKTKSNTSSNKSKIDLFDPNPPEFDESDNKSESQSQISLENEPVSYGSMNADRALLFDTEPPLLSNESSGIVRDQSNSRNGEDSSFNPYFTSTIDQLDYLQNQSDSLLTTKNKSIPGGSNLPSKIFDNPSLTKIDITPSGSESSLFDNSKKNSVFVQQSSKPIGLFDEQENNLFGDTKPENLSQKSNSFKEPNISEKKDKNSTEKNKKNLLFVDSDSEGDDLFSNKSSESKNSSASDILTNSTIKSTKSDKNIFQDDLLSKSNTEEIFSKTKNLESSSSDEFNTTKNDKNDDLFDRKTPELNFEQNKFSYEENLESDVVKTGPKKSLSFEKNVQETEDAKEEPDGQILSTGTSSGKLKHSLNINVAALLPGASPPRRQNLEKSASLDSSENKPTDPPIENKTESIEKINDSKVCIEKSISFDQPISTEEILASANKERVKIPVRRRPSSRRARQEAIRKSAIDLNFEDTITENDKNVNESDKIETQNILNIANNNCTPKDEEKIKNPLLNPLTPSTDEEDFLTMPRDKDLSSENFEDSLFGKAPVISPVDLFTTKKINTSEPDDLFDSIQTKEENKGINKTDEPARTTESCKTKVKEENKRSNKTAEPAKTAESSKIKVKAQSKEEENKRSNKTAEPAKTAESTKTKVKVLTKEEENRRSNKTAEPAKTTESSKTKDLFEDVDDIFVSNKKELKPKKADTSIFSSSDSENDLFSTPKSELKKSDNNNLIISSPDEDLFKPAVLTTSSIPKTDRINILSREDSLFEDEDIFSTKRLPPKSAIIKKSLFDDDDDNDDDIFGGSSSSVPKPTQTQRIIKKKAPIPSRLKKLSSDIVQDIDDPLEAMKK